MTTDLKIMVRLYRAQFSHMGGIPGFYPHTGSGNQLSSDRQGLTSWSFAIRVDSQWCASISSASIWSPDIAGVNRVAQRVVQNEMRFHHGVVADFTPADHGSTFLLAPRVPLLSRYRVYPNTRRPSCKCDAPCLAACRVFRDRPGDRSGGRRSARNCRAVC